MADKTIQAEWYGVSRLKKRWEALFEHAAYCNLSCSNQAQAETKKIFFSFFVAMHFSDRWDKLNKQEQT